MSKLNEINAYLQLVGGLPFESGDRPRRLLRVCSNGRNMVSIGEDGRPSVHLIGRDLNLSIDQVLKSLGLHDCGGGNWVLDE